MSAKVAGARAAYIAPRAASSPARARASNASGTVISASRVTGLLDARARQKVAGPPAAGPDRYTSSDALDARVAELVDAADSERNLSPRGEIPEVKPVKLGEGPGAVSAPS